MGFEIIDAGNIAYPYINTLNYHWIQKIAENGSWSQMGNQNFENF